MLGRRRLQFAVACGLIVGYAVLSHYCNAVGAASLGAALALSPLTLLVLVLAWRWTPVAAIVAAVGLGAMFYAAWPLLQKNFSLINLLQEAGTYGILGVTFGRSLGSQRIALCTQLADKLHGPLSPAEVAYTRRVTAAWAAFFFVTAAVSIVLYATMPVRIWSIYAYFCMPPLTGAMFVAEYCIRRRVLPKVESGGLIATLRIYFASPQR